MYLMCHIITIWVRIWNSVFGTCSVFGTESVFGNWNSVFGIKDCGRIATGRSHNASHMSHHRQSIPTLNWNPDQIPALLYMWAMMRMVTMIVLMMIMVHSKAWLNQVKFLKAAANRRSVIALKRNI